MRPPNGWVKNNLTTPKLSKLKRSTLSKLLKLTGELKELLTQFKTKLNAVPAGLSLPSLLWKVPISSNQEISLNCPSNNLLTAIRLQMDAMVVSKSGLSTMLRQQLLNWSQLTHIKVRTKHARTNPEKDKLVLYPTKPSKPRAYLPLNLLSNPDQLASQLMLPTTTFKDTPVVFLTPRNAVTTSITPSPPLVTDPATEKNTPSSETPGLPPGEKKVTSECPSMLPETVSAVSS